MLDRIGGDFAGGEHVLDEVNAPARAIELIPEQDICRAGRGAKPAMGAGPQYLFGRCNVRIGELLGREIGPAMDLQFRSAARLDRCPR